MGRGTTQIPAQWSPRSWGAVSSLQFSLSSGTALASENTSHKITLFPEQPTSRKCLIQVWLPGHFVACQGHYSKEPLYFLDYLPGSAKILISPIWQLTFTLCPILLFSVPISVDFKTLPNKYTRVINSISVSAS